MGVHCFAGGRSLSYVEPGFSASDWASGQAWDRGSPEASQRGLEKANTRTVRGCQQTWMFWQHPWLFLGLCVLTYTFRQSSDAQQAVGMATHICTQLPYISPGLELYCTITALKARWDIYCHANQVCLPCSVNLEISACPSPLLRPPALMSRHTTNLYRV